MVLPRMGVRNIIVYWPEDAKEIARAVIDKYGEPNEATPSMLIWYNNGPWKKTIVYRDTHRHEFPTPHSDGLEQFIDHEIPMEKCCELSAFNGSLAFSRTRGEISSCCHDEPSNFLAINLAHDIIRDKKTFEQARRYYAQSMMKHRQNRAVSYMEKLQFAPELNTPDPDEGVTVRGELTKAASE